MERDKVRISLGILVSYDYEYLKTALPKIYDYVGFIVLAIDKGRKTWRGENFSIPDSFFSWLDDFDKDNKINLFEYNIENDLTSMQKETLLRNQITGLMPDSDWYMQIDTDEYIVNPENLLCELAKVNTNEPVSIFGYIIPIFKSDSYGKYIIDTLEEFPFIANYPQYSTARHIENVKKINMDIFFLHQSWDRPVEEIRVKLKNWGHNTDFEINDYFRFWESINKFNYRYIKNFHPLVSTMWPELFYIQTLSLDLESKDDTILSEYITRKIQDHKDSQRFLEEKRKRENSFKYRLKKKIKKILKFY